MIIKKIYYHILAIIKKIIYKIIYGKHIKFGKKVTFRKGFSLTLGKDAFVEIGDNCFFNNYCSINALESIKIGDNCLFGENVKIYDHNHIFNLKETLIKKQGFKNGAISIENNCWICSDVIILKNAKIGSNSVIGCKEKVNREIKSNSIYKDGEIMPIKYKEIENA